MAACVNRLVLAFILASFTTPSTVAAADPCLANGCISYLTECWCASPADEVRGIDLCGYDEDYKGPYYSLDGRVSADGCDVPEVESFESPCPAVAGQADPGRARAIAEAFAFETFGAPLQIKVGDDCATNTHFRFSAQVLTAGFDCWDNNERWTRGFNIVRCTNLETTTCGNGTRDGAETCDEGLANSDAAGSYCRSDCTHRTCGVPKSGKAETPAASDALFILRAAVGLEVCSARVCDVDGSGATNASDALRALKRAVGIELALTCPIPCDAA